MKKNKKSRIFSRVLTYLCWANAHRWRGKNSAAYREVTAAKRLIEDFGGEDVRPVFYEREWHIQFTLYHDGHGFNRYYTVDASGGYVNDYYPNNKSHVNDRIGKAEFNRDCRLCRDFHDYQTFNEIAESLLYEILTPDEFSAFCLGGEVSNIPYDITLRLWQDLRECAQSVVYEAIAHKKVVL